MSKEERSGWRDEWISARHRKWGIDCPAVDVDWVVVEYDGGIPRGLVEYKHARAKQYWTSEPSYRALVKLANAYPIPIFACRYNQEGRPWEATPLNRFAKAYLPKRTIMSEQDWVALLYRVRGREMPPGIFPIT